MADEEDTTDDRNIDQPDESEIADQTQQQIDDAAPAAPLPDASVGATLPDAQLDQIAAPSPSPPEVQVQAPPATSDQAIQRAGTAIEGAYSASKDKAAAQANVGNEIANQAEGAAQSHEGMSVEQRAQEQELRDQQAAHAKGLEDARRLVEAKQQEVADFKFHDYFQDHSRVGAKIFAAAGGYLQGAHGGPNYNLESIHKSIEADYQKQRDALADKKQFVTWAKEGEKDLASRYQQERASLLVQQGKATQAAGEEMKAQLLRNGVPMAQAENDVTVKGLLQQGAQTYANGEMQLARVLTQKELAKAKAARAHAAGGGVPIKTAIQLDAVDRQNINQADREIEAFKARTVVWPKLIGGNNALNQARAALEDPKANTLQIKDSMRQMASYVNQGRAATEGEMHFLYNKLNGVFGPTLGDRLNSWATGDVMDADAKQFRQAYQAAKKENREHGIKTLDTFREKFGPGKGNEKYGAKYDAEGAALAKQFGLKYEPMFPDAEPVRLGDLTRFDRKGNQIPSSKPKASASSSSGVRVRLRDGRTGMLFPGGKFQPDEAAP